MSFAKQEITDLDELVRAVTAASPQLADCWETTAIIESLGYTDRAIQEEFGFANSRALGEYIFTRITSEPFIELNDSAPKPTNRLLTELRIFIEQFFRSFIYALPWLVTFIFDLARPTQSRAFLPPELAAPLSLAVMGSLITSGGFIQVIARRGQFYLNLNEPMLARRVCAQFLRVGLVVTILLAFIGLLFGFYRSLFTDEYLLIAAGYYILLSVLWMVCAIVSIQQHAWRIPLIFTAGGALFLLLKLFGGMSALLSQLLASIPTFVAAILLAIRGFRTSSNNKDAVADEMELPRLPALMLSLAPYFAYGIAYFSFLFADRITAGTAVSLSSGLSFAVDADYKRGMDLALLNFLIIAALVEYFNYKFMHYWYAQAAVVTTETVPEFIKRLRGRYLLVIGLIIITFLFFAGLNRILFNQVINISHAKLIMRTSLIGNIGYLIFLIGLFNGMVLFSLARPVEVLRALLPGLMVNMIVGYILSNLFGPHNAAIGLVLGATLFLIQSLRAIKRALDNPDYAYYAA